MPTQVETQAARSAAIVALAAHQLSGVWAHVDWESSDAATAVTGLYGGIVSQFGQATAAVAAEQYDELRAEAGIKSHFQATPADPFPQAAIEKAVKSAFLGNSERDPDGPRPMTTSDLPVDQRVATRLTTTLQRRVMQPARDTVAQNAAKDPAQPRYIRVPRGASTCAFCIMLASRDLATVLGKTINMTYLAHNVKMDAETGRLHVFSDNGDKFHDNCDCEAVPIFGNGGVEEVSPNFHHYQDLYNKAAAEAGTYSDVKKILASMRRLTNDGAIEEGRPDVRDRAGENNRRAPALEVGDAHEGDDEEQPTALDVDHGTDTAAPADRPDVADALDELDDEDGGAEDYADLGDPVDVGEPGPKAPETKLDKALREMAEAAENGADDDEIDRLADLADKLQDQADKAAAKRAAAKDDVQRRILELIEGGEDPQHAEAEVVSQSPANVKRAQQTSERAVYNTVLEKIRRRDFMAQARADGHYGNSFDALVEQTFWTMADEAYFKAEAATNGAMLKRKYEGKIEYRKLWYLNEATARKYMSEEMAEWFDQNGRLTLPILKAMILEGENTYTRHHQDFWQ